MNPKVSVIVPIYGVEKYIERCAVSLMTQSYANIEYIFINDCTQDNSMEVLHEVISRFPERQNNIIIKKMSHNSGLPTVRKYGVSIANGDYILHCDSDDWLHCDMCKIMVEKATEENADIVWCDYYKSDGCDTTYIYPNDNKKLLTGPVWNKLFRRSLYLDNDIEYPIYNKAEDSALTVQLSFFSQKTVHVKQALYYYFYNPDSMCRVLTKEACLSRFEQELANTELRITFLKKHHALGYYNPEVIEWKSCARNNLLPYFSEKEIRKLWQSTYKEINIKYLLSNYFGYSARFNHLRLLIKSLF